MDPLSTQVVERRADLLSPSSAALFEQFLNERRYLKNVTPDTIEWYKTAFKAFRRTLNDDAPPMINTEELKPLIVSDSSGNFGTA